jgi:signal transduction histidine kinase
MSSIEQADAEEEMEQLLQKAGVENGWKVASTLVSVGRSSQELKCMHEVFSGEELSDSLNWLESLVSSVQLVGTVEESLGRVKDLIMAVKHYSYDDESTERTVDVHDSIQSTLLILGHKLRQKSLTVERDFAKNVPPVHLRGGGLSQVWTNLLDNAIDASPEGGVLRVTTWNDEASVYAAIEDHGTGIAPADAPHVFEPFYTTKPVGEGTGLGLDIVHRILGMKLGGTVRFDSVPGKTVFTVSLPVAAKKEEPQPA